MIGSRDDGPVFADERQARIAELVSVRGRARIGELAEAFGVTEPTIRKDLSALQERGLLKRTHGGALAVQPTVDRELAHRQAAHRASKEAIRYLVMVSEVAGPRWLDPGRFRFGASSLLNDLLLQRHKLARGSYDGPDYVTLD